MDNDYFGLGTHEWIGIVLPYESQKDQSDGNAGFGYRFKVAMMGNHPNNNTIKDKDIVYALVRLGPTDGTGAGSRKKTPAISQGDVVTGKFLDGDRKQNPLITGVLGRPQGTQYGTQRFDSKTGFVGSTKAGTLLGRQEFSEQVPLCTPKAKSGTAKPKRKSPLAAMKRAGLPTGLAKLNAFAQPFTQSLAQVGGLVGDTLEVIGTPVTDIIDQLTDQT